MLCTPTGESEEMGIDFLHVRGHGIMDLEFEGDGKNQTVLGWPWHACPFN